MDRPILIGIAGASGSGKTLVAETLINRLGSDRVVMIQQDAYYRDLSNLSYEERKQQNFDHPDAIDEKLLIQHIQNLQSNKPIERPIYDFTQHLRKKETVHIGKHDIIILEGILILQSKQLRNLMDIKVYVDADPDICLIRRLRRDLRERERSIEEILQQYEDSVRPMYLQFVEPSKRYAHIIVPEGGKNFVAIDLLQTKIKEILRQKYQPIE